MNPAAAYFIRWASWMYLRELENHLPKSFSQYEKNLEKKRFCERTLQLMIEICIDISQLLVKELKLGLPTEEESVFEKLEQSKVISPALKRKLIEMKKFRNVLIHKYTDIIDRLVYEHAAAEKKDFINFKKEIIAYLKKGIG